MGDSQGNRGSLYDTKPKQCTIKKGKPLQMNIHLQLVDSPVIHRWQFNDPLKNHRIPKKLLLATTQDLFPWAKGLHPLPGNSPKQKRPGKCLSTWRIIPSKSLIFQFPLYVGTFGSQAFANISGN